MVLQFSQFSRSFVSDSLRPHESQHARPPCPSPTPGVHSNSRPSSPWCHPAISSSVVPFSSFPQSLPASESFPMSQLFAWGGQSTGVSALASFLPRNTQGWYCNCFPQSFRNEKEGYWHISCSLDSGKQQCSLDLLMKGDQKWSIYWDFPGGPVIKMPCWQCRGYEFNPWSEN